METETIFSSVDLLEGFEMGRAMEASASAAIFSLTTASG